MDFLFSMLHQGLSYILPFFLLLGALIFVHEMGHFLVAKYFGVRVETFSLGFGKKILHFRKGDTEYCLSIIPFGGYVKMYGDDPTASVEEHLKPFSFIHKPLGQRVWIVLAGPLMNLIFAFVLFTTISKIGEKVAAPVIGDVPQATAAYQAGFHPGDKVLKINQKEVSSWDELNKTLAVIRNEDVHFTVQRSADGASTNVEITSHTQLQPNKDILSDEAHVGAIEGLSYLAQSTTIGISSPSSLAAKAGFKTGDLIAKIGNHSFSYWYEVENYFTSLTRPSVLSFEVTRENEKSPLKISISAENIKSLKDLGLESSEMFIASVVKDSAAEQAGVIAGDKVTAIQSKNISSWLELTTVVRSFNEGQSALDLQVVRGGETKSFQLKPKVSKQANPATGKEESNFALGIVTALNFAKPPLTEKIAGSLGQAFVTGSEQTWLWTRNTVMSFVRLAQNRVSAKSIGGPIMIGQLAGETFKLGASAFLKIMAIISINLFVLNLLPIPVLDGGHLFIYLIEAVKGAPLSLKNIEIAQRVGLTLLLALMFFALFNDISRVFGFTW